MKNLIKNAYYGLADSFRLVGGNARVIVLTQPFWSVPYNLYFPFLSLYMNRLGCSMEQIGFINAAGMLFGAVIALFAGWLTDRLGRRRANLIADTTCWALTCLIWGLAQNFTWFLIASLTNAFVRLISVSWNCTLAEGTPPERRLNVYWWINISGTISVFFTPLMGLFFHNDDPASFIHAMRCVLIVSAAIQAVAFTARNFKLKETPIGLERMAASRHESPLAALKSYVPMFRLFRGHPMLLVYIAMRSLYYVQAGLKGTYQPITIVNGLGFADGVIGTMNLVTGAVMLLAQFLLLPRLKSLPPKKTLYASITLIIVSTAMLALSPAHNTALLVSSTVLNALGSLVTALLVDTSMANALPDEGRAPMLAFMTILIVVLSAVFMWLGGLLAGLPGAGPRLPMGLMALLIAACMALLAMAGRIGKSKIQMAQSTPS